MPEGSAPSVKSKSHSITADVEIPQDGAEGVLLAMGGDEAGYVLYVKDNKLVYNFNYYSYDHYKVTSTTEVPAGKVQLKMDFKYDGGGPGKGGTATLFINGNQAGEGRIEKTIPGKFAAGLHILLSRPTTLSARGSIVHQCIPVLSKA